MSFKGLHAYGFMFFAAVGLPLFIFHDIFHSGAPLSQSIKGLREIEGEILTLPKEGYRTHSVQDDSGILRVNILLDSVPQNERELRVKILEVLYDIQTLVGKKMSIAIWAGTSSGDDPLKLQGVAFYSSINEDYHFRNANEIE